MQKFLKAMHKNEKGFTLVELMVVVVIIGILVAIAIPIYATITTRAEQGSVEANLRILDGAVMMYYAEETEYPAIGGGDSLDEYVEGTVADLNPGNYDLYANPSGNEGDPPRAGADGTFGGKTFNTGDPAMLPVDWSTE